MRVGRTDSVLSMWVTGRYGMARLYATRTTGAIDAHYPVYSAEILIAIGCCVTTHSQVAGHVYSAMVRSHAPQAQSSVAPDLGI